jgi:hypothetical protein
VRDQTKEETLGSYGKFTHFVLAGSELKILRVGFKVQFDRFPYVLERFLLGAALCHTTPEGRAMCHNVAVRSLFQNDFKFHGVYSALIAEPLLRGDYLFSLLTNIKY